MGFRRSPFRFKAPSSAAPAPVISNIVSTPDSYYTTITWTTDIATTSKVQYGTTTSYTETPVTSAVSTTNHSVMINRGGSGLLQNTLYHFKVGNISGTSVSSDQTTTTVRLQVPKFGSLFSAPSTVFVDAAGNWDGVTQLKTTRSAPLIAALIDMTGPQQITNDANDGFQNIWIRGNKILFDFDSEIDAAGSVGGDAQDLGFDGTEELFRGGDGALGGGGGGGADSTGGGVAGGAGGVNGAAGANGQDDGLATHGDGGAGLDYEGYTGEGGFFSITVPAGGAGGNANLAGAGGGGGHGNFVGMSLNEFVGQAVSSSIFCNGGVGGQATAGGDGGNAGVGGYAVIFCRKKTANLSQFFGTQIYWMEVSGIQGAFTFTLHTGNSSATWDHLYQP